MKKISIYHYIAYSGDPDIIRTAQKVITSYGLHPARNQKDMVAKLQAVVKNYGDAGLEAVKTAHPDRKLFESPEPEPETKTSGFEGDNGQKMNACGCGGAYSNATGDMLKRDLQEIKQAGIPKPSFFREHGEIILFGAIIITVVGMLTKKSPAA